MEYIMENQKEVNYVKVGLYIFCFLPFLAINGIKNNMPEALYQTWQICSVGLMFLILAIKNTVWVNKFVKYFILYKVEVFLVTTIFKGFSYGILVVDLAAIFIILLMCIDYREILKALVFIGTFAGLINLYSIIKNTSADEIYFIGGKNSFSMFLIPMLFLSIINSNEKHGTIIEKVHFSNYFFVALCTYTIFWGASGSGIISMITVLLLMFLFSKYKPNKLVVVGIIAFANILLVFNSTSLFSSEKWIDFVEFLGKDATMTSRTLIWERAFNLLDGHYLFGIGRGSILEYKNFYDILQLKTEAHNLIVELLLNGGIVGFILFFSAVLSLIRKIDISQKKQRYVFFAIIAMFVNGLTESINNNYLLTILFAIGNYYCLCDARKRSANE